MELDRAELRDVAGEQPRLVRELAGLWNEWAERSEVIPWQQILDLYTGRGRAEEDAWM
jgi:hypothetical protein